MRSLSGSELGRLSDKDLILYVINNNSGVINYLFYDKCKELFSYIRKHVFSNQVDRDELVSEFYIYLSKDNWKVLRGFEGRSRLTTWLSVVAVRFFLKKRDSMIDSGRKNTLSTDEAPDVCSSSQTGMIEKMDVINAIQKLKSPRDKFVVMAMEIEGCEADEVAGQLGVTKANLYNIKKRALEKLSIILMEYSHVSRSYTR